ncbi:hypothetical protein DUI87_35325 [Hirundo rustica rustica]|nr:hypothetical protein DUI87_35325 [Hirundo rustica rustica]
MGYCREAGSVKQVQRSGTELPLHCSKPVYRGVVTQENAPADDWQASTSSRPELQWGPRAPRDDREANEGNFRATLTATKETKACDGSEVHGHGDSQQGVEKSRGKAKLVGEKDEWTKV